MLRHMLRRMLQCCAMLVACLSVASAQAADVTVFAAASLKESLDAVVREFERQSSSKVVVSYAASSALARQIENGAPADVFFSADLEWMDYLTSKRLIVDSTRTSLLRNELVLIAPTDSKLTIRIEPNLDLRSALGEGRLAIANPDMVPAGKYGKAALTHYNAWSAVEQRLARAENVRAALLLVALGEAPLGIVYRTDALAEPRVRVVASFPPVSHPDIVYPAAVTSASRSTRAKPFLDFLSTPAAAMIWTRYGFRVLAAPASPR
ncbi:MAG: molybdate ABC transporter substrate-binding protein [Burkholderiales bacterium]